MGCMCVCVCVCMCGYVSDWVGVAGCGWVNGRRGRGIHNCCCWDAILCCISLLRVAAASHIVLL